MNRLVNHRYLIVLLTALFLSVPFINRGLFESSEGRYAMVAKTMVDTGDYWIPRLNGQSHLTKPPVTYWFIALGQKLLGMNTAGSRMMHMFLWLVVALIIIRVGELLSDKQTGFIMGLIFTTGLFPSLGFSFLTTDPVLVGFQFISFTALLEYRLKAKPIYAAIFWTSLGLAFSTKGPVALLPVLFWMCFDLKLFRRISSSFNLLFFFIFSTFWYLGLEIQNKDILVTLFKNEIIKRSSTDFSGRNAYWWAPVVTYFIPLVVGWGLWPLFIEKNHLIPIIKKSENRIYVVWLIGTLIIFSFIQSRLVLYVLPLCLPVTILLAQMLKKAALKKAFIYNFVLVFMIKAVITIIPFDNNAKQVSKFSKKYSEGKKVYFLDEYLYGVEFYMGKNFHRFPTHWGVFKALKRKEKINWIVYQDKRKDLIDRIVSTYKRKITARKKLGKWNLVKIENHLAPRLDKTKLTKLDLHVEDQNIKK